MNVRSQEVKRIKRVEFKNDSRAAQVGEGGIRSKSRVPRNEEEEERAGGKRERKENTGGGGGARAVKGEKRKGASQTEAPKEERERERETKGAQEDKGRVLMIKGRPHGKQKIKTHSPQLKSNQIQR